MKLKVCGMKMPLNMERIDELEVDFMGFIFAEESPRFLGNNDSTHELIRKLKTEKVGVFVNANVDEIYTKSEQLGLSTIQLHGEESPEIIEVLKKDFKVIKALSVYGDLTLEYENYSNADYFIFDTKGPKRGGNGVKFNWDALKDYKGDTPFFLSGGIAPDDVEAILDFDHPKCIGVDINSRFEVFPGFKKVDEVSRFISNLRLGKTSTVESENL